MNMTEYEALELMKSLQISKDCELVKAFDFKATVIKALENLQQYRAIGTIEEFKDLKEKKTEILLKDGQLLYQQGVVDGYAKGIDVYVEKLKYNFGNDEELDSWATYDEIAEQLKAGEKNE